jgi:hypothetical protein
MARARHIDFFECTTVGIRKLVGSDAYDWSILCVELAESFVYYTTVCRDDIGNAKRSPKQWTRVVA